MVNTNNMTANSQQQRRPPPPPPMPQKTSTHAAGRPGLPSTPTAVNRMVPAMPQPNSSSCEIPTQTAPAPRSLLATESSTSIRPLPPPPPPPTPTIQTQSSIMHHQQKKQQTETLIQPLKYLPSLSLSPSETERAAQHPPHSAPYNRQQYQNDLQQRKFLPPTPSSINNSARQQSLPSLSAPLDLTTQPTQQIPLLHAASHHPNPIPKQHMQPYDRESSRSRLAIIPPPPPPPPRHAMPPQEISQSRYPLSPLPPPAHPVVSLSAPPLQHQVPTQQYNQQQPNQQQHLQYPQRWQQHSQNLYSHPIPPSSPSPPSSSPSQYTQSPSHTHQPHLLPPQPPSHSHKRDKIDPTQIPRIPLFTRPHHAPATIYPPSTSTTTTTYLTTMDNVRQQMALHPLPPPSDSRYVVASCNNNTDYHHNVLVSPRIMRSTVHTFPTDNATLRKCGDLPLGLVITPLAAMTNLCGSGKKASIASTTASPSSLSKTTTTTNNTTTWSTQWNGREQGEIYGKSNAIRNGIDTTNEVVVDYIPLSSVESTTAVTDNEFDEDGFDPERIPVIYDPKRVLTPPRCDRCQAYLNPFCTPVSTMSSNRFNYNNNISTQHYNCNICGASSSIAITEEFIVNGTFDAATRCSTVEYEVGGAYCVRKEGPVQNVHLYGIEYVPPSDQNGETLDQQAQQHHHHHGNIKSHGWYEALNAIREVARGLSITAAPNANVSIGLFAFYQDMLVFPYLIQLRPQPASCDGSATVDDRHHVLPPCMEYDSDSKLAVAIVSDVTDDPICPLPLHVWTHDVGKGLDSNGWKRFNRILDSFTHVMDQLLSSYPASNLNANQTRNCGGAALAALADALKDSGGRATLITTRRPNFGVGALADREKYGTPSSRSQHLQQSPYRNASDEQKLFTPLQHLCKSLPDAESIYARAGNFYRKLGEQCAMQRVCIDIVVTSAVVTPPPPTSASNVGTEAIHPNLREFLDVATLAELCRNTCGKFKWLRVGNECGVAVGDGRRGRGESFSSEQLREELERSALAYAGSDVVFKLRCSSGVQVKSYCPEVPVGTLVGDGIVNSAELELSNIHSGTSIAVLLEHNIGGVQDTQGVRRGIDSPMVFFQSAVLYTTLTGRRRVRVSTMGLVTTKVPADVYRSADLGTVAAIMTRQVISDLEDRNEGSIIKARSNVFQKCVEVLANYRAHTSARTSPEGQLVLPESLQLLPLFCLSLRKSRLLRNSSIPFKRPFPSADERAYHIFYCRMASPHMSLQCVHPNLFQLSDMRTLDGEWIKPPALETHSFAGENVIAVSMHRVCQLPKSMNPSITCLDEKGMYILDDRFSFYLFIGKEVPEEHWRELLSVSTPSGTHRVGGDWISNVPMGAMAVAFTESGRKLRNILHQLRDLNAPSPTLAISARHTYAPLILVFVGRGSVFEEEMDSLLVDDPDEHEKSYVDFLCDVHTALRQRVKNECDRA